MIYRTHKNANYSTIDNRFLTDKTITPEARFLLAYYLSKPADWHFQNWHILEETGLSEYKFKSLMRELKEQGYVQKSNTQVAGKYVWTTDVFETRGRDSIGSISTDSNPIGSISTDKENMRITKHENQENIRTIHGNSSNRDLVFEAVCHVCKIDWTKLTKSGRGAIGKAVKELKAVDATPEEIYVKAKILAAKHSVAITPSSLAKHWASLTPESVEQIITDKQRNKALDEYHATQSNMSGIAQQQMEWLEKGLIDQDGNYIKQGEIE